VFAGTGGRVTLKAPFLNLTKAGIAEVGLGLRVPYSLTRTCYKAQEDPCGVCGSCNERLEAFALNGTEDPVKYEGEIR
jgi:7-cyano-7-deazaguanine synthase